MYYKLKRILAPIDFSAQDEQIITFLSAIARMVDVEEIFFLHVIPQDHWTKEPGYSTGQSIEELLESKFATGVAEHFKDHPTQIHFRIKHGSKAETIVTYAKNKMIDLIAIGKKRFRPDPSPKPVPEEALKYSHPIEFLTSSPIVEKESSGYLVRKVANISPCSMLIIPENLPATISHVIVPVDFNDASKVAMEKAYEISFQSANNPKIDCLHVFSAPINGFHTGMNYKDWIDSIAEGRRRAFEDFFKKTRIPERSAVNCKFIHDPEGDSAKVIARYAQQIKASAICIGTEGRSFLASLILGDVAERLLAYELRQPLFIIKDRTKNIGFFDALFKL